MKKLIIVAVVSTLLVHSGSQALFGQRSKQLSLTAINESIAFPFTSYSEFHPGLELGVSILSNEKGNSIHQFNAYGGWFLHQYVENSFFIRGEYSYKYLLGDSFTAGIYAGAGYMHTFYPGTVYQMDEGTGEFNPSSQYGRPRALISAGLQISYRTKAGIEPFVKQEFGIETPFANGIPLMPHSFLKLGININI